MCLDGYKQNRWLEYWQASELLATWSYGIDLDTVYETCSPHLSQGKETFIASTFSGSILKSYLVLLRASLRGHLMTCSLSQIKV